MSNNFVNLLVIGDSISVDQSAFNAYPVLVRNYLRDVGKKSVRYINRAMSGWTALGMSKTVGWASNYEADIVIINLGINDANNGVYTSAYDTQMQLLIDRLKLRNPDVKIILCCPTWSTDATRQTNLPQYRIALESLATKNKCLICHLENAWAMGSSATYTSDGLHPTSAGHILMYNLLVPIIDYCINYA